MRGRRKRRHRRREQQYVTNSVPASSTVPYYYPEHATISEVKHLLVTYSQSRQRIPLLELSLCHSARVVSSPSPQAPPSTDLPTGKNKQTNRIKSCITQYSGLENPVNYWCALIRMTCRLTPKTLTKTSSTNQCRHLRLPRYLPPPLPPSLQITFATSYGTHHTQ